MINKLRGNPVIRHYQFWFYSYLYPYSASILRRELDAVEKRFLDRKPMVVIGHSMGGCISRLLLTDSGDKLWMALFKKPPEQVPVSPRTRKYFTEELFFRHRPEVGRVIFIAAVLSLVAVVQRVRIPIPRWGEFVPPYAIGTVAMFWIIQRVALF
jgi:pimeloyl-ACP methyl ester carboxylesterase